ncbi:MAG: hypothetical protein KY475_21445 [Planctomycetes bacterium]|nr:hypothetical protein [Planctomycetota bacterium]
MHVFRLFSLALVVSVVLATQTVADESKDDPEAEINLVGTWKLVSAKYGGQESTLPQAATTLKHITPTHYTWLTYGEDGTITRGAGGTYTLEGDEFTQTGMYDVEPRKLLKGKNTYKCRVEGNKWYHTGMLANGLTIDEVWERIEKE